MKEQRLDLLEGVHLAVDKGEFVSIMGRSGSGKSTLLHLIGLLDAPDQGEIKIMGQSFNDVTTDTVTDFKKNAIGYVFQQYNLFPNLSVIDNLCMPFYFEPYRDVREVSQYALELLQQLGLASRKDYLVKHLSGGEQQRVALIRCMLSRPPILLADEPTGSVDADSEEEIMKLLRSMNDTAIIVVTHNEKYKEISDSVYGLEHRKLTCWKGTSLA
ncbi:ABC transporter ATP-binding protein [Paenibacillus popilliae]|nr:ABC transporter ATP-binding protein [Paenibacillus popilliae]